jgi:predicted nuclease of predicted toxin-antitoxin system
VTMNFICDVHIPYRLVNHLLKEGHQATHINRILEGSKTKDIEIARFADINNQIVVTKDEDFKNLHFANNTPKKLIRVLLGNISTLELIQIFEKHLSEIEKLKEFNRFYIEIGKDQFIYTTDYGVE